MVLNIEGERIYYRRLSQQNTNFAVTRSSYLSYSSYFDDVVVPATVEFEGTTYTVTEVDTDAFRHCPFLNSVTLLPNTITTIGNYAFKLSKNMSYILLLNQYPSAITLDTYALDNECSIAASPLEIKDSYTVSAGIGVEPDEWN